MSEYQLNLTLLVPAIDSDDQCIHHLTDRLETVRGVDRAHIIHTNGTAELCLRYDPNLVSLAKLERSTRDVGVQISDEFRHVTLPFAVGLSRASRAITQQNLAISSGMIALLVVTSVLGWIQLSGTVVLHEGSTIVVVINALRLLAFRFK